MYKFYLVQRRIQLSKIADTGTLSLILGVVAGIIGITLSLLLLLLAPLLTGFIYKI